MKSQINVMEIDQAGVRMDGMRRYMSKEERIKIQRRKKLKAKRRRRLKMRRLALNCALLLVILVIGRLLVLNIMDMTAAKPENYNAKHYGAKNDEAKNNEPVQQYEVEAPQVIEDNEIKARLKSLTEKYPEFNEIYENMEAYPEELILSLCNNPEMIDFVKGYLTSDGSVTGGLSNEELATDFPLLLQWDKRWGYASYGGSNIAMSGCAPTCLSMVIVGLTKDKDATPNAVSDYSMSNGFYVEGTGTMWSLMTEGGKGFGVQGQELGLDENKIFNKLSQGSPIICSMRPGDFTTTGHFIVLTGVEDGKIRLNDPNCIERSNRLWDFKDLQYQIKNLWAFTKG